jgi:predicted dehydrogenase
MERRDFIKTTAMAGLGVLAPYSQQNKRVGIIGLDTSHSMEIIKALNGDFKVVAAYPRGSKDIPSSADRIPKYTEEAKNNGVTIVNSISDLLKQVDYVCLETNDGRPRLEQATEVIKAGKPMFIDKPVAVSLDDVVKIYKMAAKNKVPIFSSSSLRYITGAQELASIGKVLGADTYSPARLEPHHPDFFWYGIHGIETLYTVMGTGCISVSRTFTEGTDVVVGQWPEGRLGVFRGTRTGKHVYGGTVYGEKGVKTLGEYKGTGPLIEKMLEFFNTGIAPVKPEETLEIYAFMVAADESKRKKGAPVNVQDVLKKASA